MNKVRSRVYIIGTILGLVCVLLFLTMLYHHQLLLIEKNWYHSTVYIFTIVIVAAMALYLFGRPLLLLGQALHQKIKRKEQKEYVFINKNLRHPTYNGVSVIVPCHNEATTIKVLVQSLLKQKVPYPIEIILIENNSTDHTFQVITNLAKDFDTIIPLSYKTPVNQFPISAALNYGLTHAKYPLIVRIDADTELADEYCIARAIQPIVDGVAVACATNVRIRNVNQSILTRLQSIEYYLAMELDRRVQQMYNSVLCCSGAMQVFRLDLLEKVGGYNTSKLAAEDMDMTWKMHRFGKIKMVPEAISYTDAPASWEELWKQRKVWMLLGVITLYSHRLKLGDYKYGHKGMLGLLGIPTKFFATFQAFVAIALKIILSIQLTTSGEPSSILTHYIYLTVVHIAIIGMVMVLIRPIVYHSQGFKQIGLLPFFASIYGLFLATARFYGAVQGLYEIMKQKQIQQVHGRAKHPTIPLQTIEHKRTETFDTPEKLFNSALQQIRLGRTQRGMYFLLKVLEHPDSTPILKKVGTIRLKRCIELLKSERLVITKMSGGN